MSYANVMSTIAVFVVIGGTSYAAITLPRNSVGASQIRSRAVGANELKRDAVTSRAIKNRSVEPSDLSRRTKQSLAGAPGPMGPQGPPAISLRAAVTAVGSLLAGNATGTETALPNKRLIDFSRSLAGCVPTAVLARNGSGGSDPSAGRIVVAIEGERVAVETYLRDGTPEHLPFNLTVAC